MTTRFPERSTRRLFLQACTIPLFAAAESSAGDRLDTSGYSPEQFEHGGIRLDVWVRGSGPKVFILHEMNGLTQKCLTLGDDLAGKGFSVLIPKFFGSFGGGPLGYFKACEGRSLFHCFDRADYGPIVPWLKALAIHKSGNEPFGAIGNCMTGVLPLVMLRSRRCVAPVLCQPAFPFRSLGHYKPALGLAPVDVEYARLRSQRDEVPVLAIRFERDGLCTRQRFDTLRNVFESRFHCLELEGKGHSTLITHRCDAAFTAVVDFLSDRLLGTPRQPPPSTCARGVCGTSVAAHGSHR